MLVSVSAGFGYLLNRAQNATQNASAAQREETAFSAYKGVLDQLCALPRERQKVKKYQKNGMDCYDIYSHYFSQLPDSKLADTRRRWRLIPYGEAKMGQWRVEWYKWSQDSFDQMYKGKSLPQIQEANYNLASGGDVEYRNCWWKERTTVQWSSKIIEAHFA